MKLQNKTILFQGDSITEMNRRWSDWDQNHLYGHSYVFLLAAYHEIIRETAEKYNCFYLPLQEEFDKAYRSHPRAKPDQWIWDGIHPTAAGHMLIARKWLAFADENL